MPVKSHATVFFLLLLVASGCESESRSEKLPSEERGAERAVAEAKESGADKHSSQALQSAQKAIDDARAAEATATREDKDGRAQLAKAEKARTEADRQLALKRADLKGAEAVRDDLKAQLDSQVAHRAELAEKGALDVDLKQTVDPEIDLTRARVRSADSMMSTLSQEVALAELEHTEAEHERDFAQSRVAAAKRRLELARSLYQRAEEQARLARAESLQARNLELRDTGAP